jgi:extracellular solute-binding protein (family 5)/alpha-L-arabinofuranosidase-like protein
MSAASPFPTESWQIEQGGLVHRFRLRPAVKWHDGTPFTAADVKFTFEEILLKFHARTRASMGALLSPSGGAGGAPVRSASPLCGAHPRHGAGCACRRPPLRSAARAGGPDQGTRASRGRSRPLLAPRRHCHLRRRGRDAHPGRGESRQDQSHKTIIDLGGAEAAGGVQVSEVTGPDVGATNSFDRPHVVGVRDAQVEAHGGKLDYEFPARSVSVLRMRLR